jgi:hypothetical protein
MAYTNKIFICIGQSNANGRNPIANLNAAYQGYLTNSRVYHQNNWEVLYNTDENNADIEALSEYGIQFYFCKDYADQIGRDIYFINYALGGTSLANSGTNNWSPGGTLREGVKDYITDCYSWFTNRGKLVEIVGVLVLQGERDSNTLAYANAWADNQYNNANSLIKELDSHIISVTGQASTPFWYDFQIPITAVRTYLTEIRAAKVSVQAARPSKHRLIYTDDATYLDGIHFDDAFYGTLTQRVITEITNDIP